MMMDVGFILCYDEIQEATTFTIGLYQMVEHDDSGGCVHALLLVNCVPALCKLCVAQGCHAPRNKLNLN